jgi:hypothetical protein
MPSPPFLVLEFPEIVLASFDLNPSPPFRDAEFPIAVAWSKTYPASRLRTEAQSETVEPEPACMPSAPFWYAAT